MNDTGNTKVTGNRLVSGFTILSPYARVRAYKAQTHKCGYLSVTGYFPNQWDDDWREGEKRQLGTSVGKKSPHRSGNNHAPSLSLLRVKFFNQ